MGSEKISIFWYSGFPPKDLPAIRCKASVLAEPGGLGGRSISKVSCIESLRLFCGLTGNVLLLP